MSMCSLRKMAPLLTTTSAFSLSTSTTALRADKTASGTSVALSTSALPMRRVYGARLESQACNLVRGSVRRDAWSCDQGPREASNRRTGPSSDRSVEPRHFQPVDDAVDGPRAPYRSSRAHLRTTDLQTGGTM